jgi:hypothetical protein
MWRTSIGLHLVPPGQLPLFAHYKCYQPPHLSLLRRSLTWKSNDEPTDLFYGPRTHEDERVLLFRSEGRIHCPGRRGISDVKVVHRLIRVTSAC